MSTSVVSEGRAQGLRRPMLAALIVAGLAVVPLAASALTMEQARETCRATVGKAFVQSCMGGQKGEDLRDACRAKATSVVRPCVMAALNKANGRANVAIS